MHYLPKIVNIQPYFFEICERVWPTILNFVDKTERYEKIIPNGRIFNPAAYSRTKLFEN